ncbi:MAG: hypothetical protein Q8Q02_05815 [Nocardioides sp.]|nr:hypothetical protein [Nocardioides sp.]
MATTTAAGPPVAVPIAEGPLRIAGTSHVSATMTALGVCSPLRSTTPGVVVLDDVTAHLPVVR